MQNSVNPKLKFDYRQLGAGAAPGSPAGVLSVAFRGRFSLIQFFKQPGQYASAISRREAPELCMGQDHPAFRHVMVLTAYFVLSPATNSSCHHRRRIKVLSKARSGRLNLRRLDTSNGARTTRLCHPRRPSTPTASTGFVPVGRSFGEGG